MSDFNRACVAYRNKMLEQYFRRKTDHISQQIVDGLDDGEVDRLIGLLSDLRVQNEEAQSLLKIIQDAEKQLWYVADDKSGKAAERALLAMPLDLRLAIGLNLRGNDVSTKVEGNSGHAKVDARNLAY